MRDTQVLEAPLTDFFETSLPGVAPDRKRLSLLDPCLNGRRFCIFEIRPEPGFFSGLAGLFTQVSNYTVEIRAALPDSSDMKDPDKCAWKFFLRSSRGPCFTIDHEGRLRGFSYSSLAGEEFVALVRRRADDPDRPEAETLLDSIIDDLSDRGVARL